MNARQAATIRQIVSQTHIASVIEVLAEICREHAGGCAVTPGQSAIGAEWNRTRNLLLKAAEVIE